MDEYRDENTLLDDENGTHSKLKGRLKFGPLSNSISGAIGSSGGISTTQHGSRSRLTSPESRDSVTSSDSLPGYEKSPTHAHTIEVDVGNEIEYTHAPADESNSSLQHSFRSVSDDPLGNPDSTLSTPDVDGIQPLSIESIDSNSGVGY